MKNLSKQLGIVLLSFLLFYGCSEDDSSSENNEIEENNEDNNNSVDSAIYFFHENNLKSLNLDNEGGSFYETESDNELTQEIYGIAYDPSDNTFFGTTHYSLFGSMDYSYFESYNPDTKERIKKKICECRHRSVTVNTNTNQKILIKEGETLEKVIFQEVNSQGEVTFESPEIDLGRQVSNFVYVSSLDAFVAKEDNYSNLKISVINANSYTLETLTLDIDYPEDLIGISFKYSDLNYDKENDILYYLRMNGLYKIDINSETVEFIETDWIEFFQSKFGLNEDLSLVKTIYYPPTNELIISGDGFFGSSSGNKKFFAIDLETKEAREIDTDYHHLDRVYGFSIKN